MPSTPSARLGLTAPLSTESADGPAAISTLIAQLEAAVWQAGDMKMTARPSAPTGWLLCDGAIVSRTTYADLFAAIGTAYGAGNGTTTFGLPDLRGSVFVGEDGSAGRLSANDARGQRGGEEKHLTTAAEAGVPDHEHHLSSFNAGGGTLDAPTVAGGKRYVPMATAGGGTGRFIAPPTTTGSFTIGIAVEGIPSGAKDATTAHNNVQPYQVGNFVIKT